MKSSEEKLGIYQTAAKTRYNSIRTNFSKYIRKLREASRSGAGRNDLPEIKGEYEHLRWLLNHIKHRQGTSNFSRRPEVAVTGGIMDSSIERASSASDTDDAEEIREPNNHELSEAGVLDVGQTMVTELVEQDGEETVSKSPSNELETGKIAKAKNAKRKAGPSSPTPKDQRDQKRAWAKENKPVRSTEIDKEMFKTMSSIQHAINNSSTGTSEAKPDEFEKDEDRLFCLSLVGQLKGLDPMAKSMVKLQIMGLLHEAQWPRNMNPSQHFQQNMQQAAFNGIPGLSNHGQYQRQRPGCSNPITSFLHQNDGESARTNQDELQY